MTKDARSVQTGCRLLIVVTMLVAIALGPTPVEAQESTTVVPRVVDVFRRGLRERPQNTDEKDYKEARNKAGLGDVILVEVSGLRQLLDLAHAPCVEPVKPVAPLPPAAGAPPMDPPAQPEPPPTRSIPNCTDTSIVLFLDGRPLVDLAAESSAPDGGSGLLQFHLLRTDATREHWADLLGIGMDAPFAPRIVTISVGLAGRQAVASDARLRLDHLRPIGTAVWLVTTLALLIALYKLARQSDLLRDRAVAVPQGARKPYSLSQCQAAWWLVLTVVSFLFIWAVTGQHDNLPEGVLVLLALGFGTALGAKVIDQGTETPAGAPTFGTPARRFDLDILSDGQGVSFHRFQMAVWSVVLGLVFVYEVITRLAMPEFSATLLGLMGLSAGTFLGFKIPESRAPSPTDGGAVTGGPAVEGANPGGTGVTGGLGPTTAPAGRAAGQ